MKTRTRLATLAVIFTFAALTLSTQVPPRVEYWEQGGGKNFDWTETILRSGLDRTDSLSNETWTGASQHPAVRLAETMIGTC